MLRDILVMAICFSALIAGASAMQLTKPAAPLPRMHSRDDVQYFPEGPELMQLPLARQAIAEYKARQVELNEEFPRLNCF